MSSALHLRISEAKDPLSITCDHRQLYTVKKTYLATISLSNTPNGLSCELIDYSVSQSVNQSPSSFMDKETHHHRLLTTTSTGPMYSEQNGGHSNKHAITLMPRLIRKVIIRVHSFLLRYVGTEPFELDRISSINLE